jgi:type I restriction enzyme S subunit
MTAWPTVKLGEVLRHRKEFITIDDLAVYKRPRVRLHVQGIVVRDEVPGALIKTKMQQVCYTDEFLVAEIDAKVGGFGIVPEILNGSIVSGHYFLFVIDESKLSQRFLDFFIRTPAFREQVAAHGSTNYAAIRPADVLRYEIPLPSLPEQRRIVARIEGLGAQIDEARALRGQAGEESEALFVSSLGQTYRRCAAAFGHQAVGSFAQVKGGKRLPAGERLSDERTPFPYIRVSDMENYSVSLRNLKFVPERLQPPIARYIIRSADVYVTIAGTIGYSGTIPDELDNANLTENAARLVFLAPGEIEKRFVAYMLRSSQVQEAFQQKRTIAAQPKLALHRIASTEIPLPPLPEQHRIVAELDALQTEVDALKCLQAETATVLDALLPSILDRAFRGEL